MNVSVVSVVDTLTGLAQNLALLLSLTLLYSVIRPYLPRVPRPLRQVAAGVLFALIAIAAMHTPFIIAPGVIADARVIPVLLAGPFGGPGAALTAAMVAAGYRAWLGGLGSAAGVGTILTAGLLGMAVTWWWRRRQPRRPAPAFLLLGVALDAIMLVWAAALPDRDLAQRVLSAAALPVGLFLPFGTLVLGMLLVHESRRHDERERLALTQFAIEHATEALFWIDAEGHIVNVNAAAAGLTGYARDELLTKRLQFFGEFVEPCRNKVISNVVESLEPECGNLIQHRALVRNRIGKDHVKCGDPIRDDKQQCLAQIKHFTHLAAAQFLNSVKID